MENENKNITESIEAAFEAEAKAVETVEAATEEDKVEAQPEKTDTETPEATDDKSEKAAEETPVEDKADEKTEEKPVAAPKQLKGDFVKTHWDSADKETKDELIRLASENERNFLRAGEAEHNAKVFRETIKPVQGYISEVAQASNIPESEVIRNCVDIIQKLNDSPTLTARQMIAGGIIRFEDPVAVINEIAKTYGIDTKGDLTPRDIPNNYYSANAQARYDARQAKYVKDEAPQTDDYVNEYINNTPGIRALLDNPDIKDKFLRQITMERREDVNASDITIINRAAEMFEQYAQPAPVAPETPKETLVEKKLAKVVSPTASNPVEQGEIKRKEMSPEESVRETLRAMGLDD